MSRRAFTVWLEDEQIEGLQDLARTLQQSASGILRGATEAVIRDPSILLRPTLSYDKRQRSDAKLRDQKAVG